MSAVNQELKSKVDELASSNSDLQNLMASTQIATVFLDGKLCIQRYTPPAVALFNLIPTDVGRPLSDLTHRLDYPDLAADAGRVLDDLRTREVEVADANGRFFLVRTLPYRTTENRIAGVVITFVDITQRRQAEEELRGSEARFRKVSNLVPDLLFSTDAAGQLRWCNERWLEYTGQTADQAQDFGWVSAVHPDDRERAWKAFLASVEQGQPFSSEHRLLRADRTARWFLVRAEPLRGADGNIVQWFGAKTDIDDFKRASSDLEASEEWLRLLVENAREFAIFSTDLEMRVTSWNPGAERLLGYAESEIRGRSAHVIFTPEDRASGRPEEETRQALAEGRAADERWHQRKDGSRFWANGALMAMRSPTGEAIGYVKILRDETAARQTREALEQSRQELLQALEETGRAHAAAEAASRAKDHFLAVLSHELRTPLTPVLMAVHMLGRNRELPAEAREALEMIERNVQIEAHFIDDLLDITRIARGRLEIVAEPMDVHQAIRHAVDISAGDLAAKAQGLTVALDAGEHQLQGDATRLQQVFWNLLKNASKFTPERGSVRVSSRNEPGRLIVEVSDTGIGFEAEVATRIFDAFTQASAEVTREFGGLGLGPRDLQSHGGRARRDLASAERGQEPGGHLRRFTATAGRVRGRELSPGRRECGEADFSGQIRTVKNNHKTDFRRSDDSGSMIGVQASGVSHPLRIFVVENHADTLKWISRYLESMGHKVLSARTMADALEALPSADCEVLISDIGLPDGDGWELLRTVRLSRPIYAIAMSGFGMNADRLKSKAAGYRHHLLKPFVPRELDDALEEADREAAARR